MRVSIGVATLVLILSATTLGPAVAAAPTRHVRTEKLALRLLNCTRTGGWVLADGRCIDRGSGIHSEHRKPLKRHQGISRRVAWKWARALVKADVCGHVLPGRPSLGERLSSRGFKHGTYGENVGCAWGMTPRQMVIATHVDMQAEMSTNGGHWRNMKASGYKSVGIGVARWKGMTAVVYDFYGRAP